MADLIYEVFKKYGENQDIFLPATSQCFRLYKIN